MHGTPNLYFDASMRAEIAPPLDGGVDAHHPKRMPSGTELRWRSRPACGRGEAMIRLPIRHAGGAYVDEILRGVC